jgi:lipid-A-disaccharide synthase
VNLIAGKEVVPELIQHNLNKESLENHLRKLLEGKHRDNMLQSFEHIIELLGLHGASEKAADLIINEVK